MYIMKSFHRNQKRVHILSKPFFDTSFISTSLSDPAAVICFSAFSAFYILHIREFLTGEVMVIWTGQEKNVFSLRQSWAWWVGHIYKKYKPQ